MPHLVDRIGVIFMNVFGPAAMQSSLTGGAAALPLNNTAPVANVSALAFAPKAQQHFSLRRNATNTAPGIQPGARLRYRTVDQPAVRKSRSVPFVTHAWPAPAAESMVPSVHYQQYLRDQRGWLDLDQIRKEDFSATQILQKVCGHRQLHNETSAQLNARLRDSADHAINEAALIAFDVHESEETIATGMPIAEIRARFASALIQEWHDTAIGCRLLPSAPFRPGHATYWYDGNAIQNGQGKSLSDIADDLFAAGTTMDESPAMQHLIDQANKARHLLGQPANMRAADRTRLSRAMGGLPAAVPHYLERPDTVRVGDVWLTRAELYTLLRVALHNLVLDPHYAGGTPLHSVATALLRLGPAHDVDFSAYNDPAAMMRAFDRLTTAWHRDPHFIFSPHLCAAHHLALDNGIFFLNGSSSITREQQAMDQITTAAAPFLTALSQQPPSTLQSEALLRLVEGTRMAMDALVAAPETFAYTDTGDLASQLHTYLNQRLLALAPLPAYDENFLIESMLQKDYRMTEADLIRTRKVPFYGGAMAGMARPPGEQHLSPLQEFRQCAATGCVMTVGDKTIDAQDALNTIRKRSAQVLFADPALIAKATELLRMDSQPYGPENVKAVSGLIIDTIVKAPEPDAFDIAMSLLLPLFTSLTIKSVVNTLGSGDPKSMLRLFPFIVPSYEIEEGIRLGDRQRAIDGLIDLGWDIALTASGLGLERFLVRQVARDAERLLMEQLYMPFSERAGVNALRSMSGLLSDLPETLPRQLLPGVEESSFSHRAEPASLLHPVRQTEPKAVGIFNARTADQRPRKTLYLIDEQRYVVVRAVPDGFEEVDLHGHAYRMRH
jgi:hypothetical protein